MNLLSGIVKRSTVYALCTLVLAYFVFSVAFRGCDNGVATVTVKSGQAISVATVTADSTVEVVEESHILDHTSAMTSEVEFEVEIHLPGGTVVPDSGITVVTKGRAVQEVRDTTAARSTRIDQRSSVVHEATELHAEQVVQAVVETPSPDNRVRLQLTGGACVPVTAVESYALQFDIRLAVIGRVDVLAGAVYEPASGRIPLIAGAGVRLIELLGLTLNAGVAYGTDNSVRVGLTIGGNIW